MLSLVALRPGRGIVPASFTSSCRRHAAWQLRAPAAHARRQSAGAAAARARSRISGCKASPTPPPRVGPARPAPAAPLAPTQAVVADRRAAAEQVAVAMDVVHARAPRATSTCSCAAPLRDRQRPRLNRMRPRVDQQAGRGVRRVIPAGCRRAAIPPRSTLPAISPRMAIVASMKRSSSCSVSLSVSSTISVPATGKLSVSA